MATECDLHSWGDDVLDHGWLDGEWPDEAWWATVVDAPPVLGESDPRVLSRGGRLELLRQVQSEQARLAIYDPKVPAEEIYRDLGVVSKTADGKPNPAVTICRDAYAAAEGAHAVVVLTEWDEFKSLDFERIFARMMKPASVFDGRNIYNPQVLRDLGFHYEGIGRR